MYIKFNTFLERIQNEGFFHDVVFVGENQRFPINRCIAAAASPVLRNMLTNGMKETFKCDIVLDVNVRAWDRVLNCMYTAAVDFDNIDEALQCLECANRFRIEELEFELSNFIEFKLDKHNCCQVVVVADRINLTGLRALAMKTIVENLHFVCRQCAFMDEAYDLILEILTDPELVVRSELDVFLAVMRWVVCSGVNEIEMEVDSKDELAKFAHETLIETGLLRPDSEFHVTDSYNMSRHNELFECVDMSMSSMDLRRVVQLLS